MKKKKVFLKNVLCENLFIKFIYKLMDMTNCVDVIAFILK